jgi:hypothetical protein
VKEVFDAYDEYLKILREKEVVGGFDDSVLMSMQSSHAVELNNMLTSSRLPNKNHQYNRLG